MAREYAALQRYLDVWYIVWSTIALLAFSSSDWRDLAGLHRSLTTHGEIWIWPTACIWMAFAGQRASPVVDRVRCAPRAQTGNAVQQAYSEKEP